MGLQHVLGQMSELVLQILGELVRSGSERELVADKVNDLLSKGPSFLEELGSTATSSRIQFSLKWSDHFPHIYMYIFLAWGQCMDGSAHPPCHRRGVNRCVGIYNIHAVLCVGIYIHMGLEFAQFQSHYLIVPLRFPSLLVSARKKTVTRQTDHSL